MGDGFTSPPRKACCGFFRPKNPTASAGIEPAILGYQINQIVLNITKANVIKFKPKTTGHVTLDVSYRDNVIGELKSTKFLGMYTGIHMHWKNHVEQILPKLGATCFSKRSLIHTLNLDILRMVCFAYFHSVLQCGIVFWGNSTHAHQVFKLQKRVVRIMSGDGLRSSYRSVFRKHNILPIACQYILSLMLFIRDNQKNFPTNSYVHGLDTRNKHLPTVNLSCVQYGVSHSVSEICNSLPSNIQSHRNDRKSFKNKLYIYLIFHYFYSITEFF